MPIRRNDSFYDGRPLPDITDEQLRELDEQPVPPDGPVRHLAPGVFAVPRPVSREGVWYPITAAGDVDLERPLGPWDAPSAELLERFREYGSYQGDR